MHKKRLLNRINELSSPVYPEKVDYNTRLKPLNNIKCVAFDFYGTMFISSSGDITANTSRNKGKERCFNEALGTCNLEMLDPSAGKQGLALFQQIIKQHTNQMKAQGLAYPEPDERQIFYHVLTTLREEKVINGHIPKDIGTQFTIEFEFRSNTIWPLPYLLNDLKKLRERNFELGIISNSQFYSPILFEALTGTAIDEIGFNSDLLAWSFQHDIKKPSLAFYRLFMNALPAYNIKPKEVLFVGNDLFRDVILAKKLDMQTALFVGDKRSIRHKKEALNNTNMPDIIIDELSQIDECLAQ